MGDFFKGWRRKIGLLTLVMACVFAAGWVRSLSIHDGVSIPMDSCMYSLWSGRGVIAWGRQIVLDNPKTWVGAKIQWVWQGHLGTEDGLDTFGIERRSILGFEVFDIHCGIGDQIKNVHWVIWLIPYWSVVIPLTLIALWLLLSKPRKPNQDKITQPIPEKVA
jgi:hypothetical protein